MVTEQGGTRQYIVVELESMRLEKRLDSWQKHVRGQNERQTRSFSETDDPSVSQTSQGKKRFKVSVVDTSAASPRTVSLWCQELTLASQCKLHYHHRHHHYHEKWKSYWVQSKAFSQTAFDKGFTPLECKGYLLRLGSIKPCKLTENLQKIFSQ